jgi:hypothetical protein
VLCAPRAAAAKNRVPTPFTAQLGADLLSTQDLRRPPNLEVVSCTCTEQAEQNVHGQLSGRKSPSHLLCTKSAISRQRAMNLDRYAPRLIAFDLSAGQ